MYFWTVAELFSSCFGYWSATVVTDNHPFIIVYIDTVSPVREQFFRLAQTSIGVLQYLLSNPLFSLCLPFEHLLTSLYLQYFFFVYFFWDSGKSLQTFAVIIEYVMSADERHWIKSWLSSANSEFVRYSLCSHWLSTTERIFYNTTRIITSFNSTKVTNGSWRFLLVRKESYVLFFGSRRQENTTKC